MTPTFTSVINTDKPHRILPAARGGAVFAPLRVLKITAATLLLMLTPVFMLLDQWAAGFLLLVAASVLSVWDPQ